MDNDLGTLAALASQRNAPSRSGGCRLPGSAPLVSVIVVVFRDARELEQIIESVERFRGPDLELVIIDGGSDDGSLELMESRQSDIDFYLSEPDRGLYEAMNKGIAHARGEFVLHINAGDRLLLAPFDALRGAAPEVAAVAFRVQDEPCVIAIPEYGDPLKRRCTLHHQGTFYRRSLHLGYDESLRVVADFDHNQRMMLAGLKVELRDELVAFHGEGGLSSGRLMLAEHFSTVKKNFGWWQMVRARFETGRFYKMVRRAWQVGAAQVLRSARRQLLERLRGEHHF